MIRALALSLALLALPGCLVGFGVGAGRDGTGVNTSVVVDPETGAVTPSVGASIVIAR